MKVPVHGHGADNEHCGPACDVAAAFAKLTERVRFHAINVEPWDSREGGATWVGCGECHSAWPFGEPEDHKGECIAADLHKSEESGGTRGDDT